jgi:hypothetical protein
MQGVKGDTVTLWSDVVRFSTVRIPPANPVIVNPLSGSRIEGESAEVFVKADPLASGITFQWSTSSSFPWNNRFQQTVEAPDSSLVIQNLTSGTWYVKCRATYSSSLVTDWSPVVSFSFVLSGIPVAEDNRLMLQCISPAGDKPLKIRFSLPGTGRMKLFLTDLTGRTVVIAREGVLGKGFHETEIPSAEVPRGIYLVVLESNDGRKVVTKIILL